MSGTPTLALTLLLPPGRQPPETWRPSPVHPQVLCTPLRLWPLGSGHKYRLGGQLCPQGPCCPPKGLEKAPGVHSPKRVSGSGNTPPPPLCPVWCVRSNRKEGTMGVPVRATHCRGALSVHQTKAQQTLEQRNVDP